MIKNYFKTSVLLILIISVLIVSCESNKKDKQTQTEQVVKTDPLPNWNEGATKASILTYVNDVTNAESENFIPVSDRIATFDNDGNLWAEQPAYFQLFFALDRIKEMAAENPEWKDQQPFKAVLENDMETIKKSGMKGIGQLLMTTHAGNTTEEFDAIVKTG